MTCVESAINKYQTSQLWHKESKKRNKKYV